MVELKFKRKEYEWSNTVTVNGYIAYIEESREGYTTRFNQKIDVPSYYNGLPVVGFGSSNAIRDNIELTLPDTIEIIYSNSISSLKIKNLKIPKNVKEIQFLSLGSSSLENIYVDPDNKYFKSIDNVIFSKDGKSLVFYMRTKTNKQYEIPKEVKTICDGAFSRNEYLEELIIPSNSVESIGDYAFNHSENLKTVRIGEGVTTIGINAFEDCKKLEEVFLPSTLTYVDKGCFSKVKKVKLYCAFSEPGKRWPKSWCNKSCEVILGYNDNNSLNKNDSVNPISEHDSDESLKGNNSKTKNNITTNDLKQPDSKTVEQLESLIIDTGVKHSYEYVDGKIILNFDYITFAMKCEFPSLNSEDISPAIKLFVKISNSDFNGCTDILLKENCKDCIDAVYQTFLGLSAAAVLPNFTRSYFHKFTDIDGYLRLISAFEKAGCNISQPNKQTKDYLFATVTKAFNYVSGKEEFNKLKKIFYYLLNTDIDKESSTIGTPIEILELYPEPERLQMANDLRKVLSEKNEGIYTDPIPNYKNESIYSDPTPNYSVNTDSMVGSQSSDNQVERVEYSAEKKSFGIIISESPLKITEKTNTFTLPVTLSCGLPVKGYDFKYDGISCEYDNCKYIGTSLPDTFSILLVGNFKMFGYEGKATISLELHMTKSLYNKVKNVVLDNIGYKYLGNNLKLVFKFSIEYR